MRKVLIARFFTNHNVVDGIGNGRKCISNNIGEQ